MENFYCQLDYEHVPYISPVSPHGNLANNGCGPCSAAMMIERMLDIPYPPEEAAKLAKACGARETFGTNFYIYAKGLAVHFNLNVIDTEDAEEAMQFLRDKKGFVVANTYGDREDYIGVFSDSGHYVLITGIEDDIISVLDPMYRPGRFDKPGRKEKVRMEGNTAYAHWTVIRDDCRERPFFLFSKPE